MKRLEKIAKTMKKEKKPKRLAAALLAGVTVFSMVLSGGCLTAKAEDPEAASRASLDQIIQEANALDEDRYSDESYSVLDEKLIVGETLPDDAAQEQVDAAVQDIQAAMEQLQPRYPNLALNKEVSVSGLEVSDGRFTAPMAVDGEVSSTSRVSFAKDQDEQWLLVDLGENKTVSYFVINYESCPPAFKIQVSADGMTFTDVYSETGQPDGGASAVKEIEIEATEARYIKYVQLQRWKHSSNGKYYSGSIYEFEVYEKNPDAPNYANLALNKAVQVSGLEVSDGRFTGEMAVDGEVSSTSRVSFAKNQDEQWLLVDLGGRKTVSDFVVNYESQAPAFKIQVSTDGVRYFDVYEASGLTGQVSAVQDITIEPVKAHYVKYVQLERWKHSGNGQYYSGSIYEFEVYKEKEDTEPTAADVLAELEGAAPTVGDDKIVLPEVPEGFEISLYGCDNQQVVTMDGDIIRPLQDMDVNVLYQVKNLNDEDDIAYSEEDINFIVPGQYTAEESMNEKPSVMPGLREWRGNEGEFALTEDSKIVVKDSSLTETASQIQFYLKEMIHRELPIVAEGETAGDIVLTRDSSLSVLGTEGYTLDIDDMIIVSSDSEKGILYGGISITQILSQDDDMTNVPKGLVRDYPKYEVRAGMLDVARTYIPMEYLREMTIYMAYFKLNEIQVHINDYWGATSYSAFRLECETYPMITAQDGSYSKDEYRQYQIDMKKYGIDVITEIDTPYHSECFRAVPGATMLGSGALDIREASSYTIIENIMDEYLDGDNPVIQSDKFHIGTDEYNKSYSEQMRAWTDHFIKYVNEKGYNTRLWGSLGSKGFNGTTPVTNEATVNLWAPYWADVKETYAAGYDIINTCGGWLYIVPGGNAGYPDRLNLTSLYNNFDVNNFAPSRGFGNGTAIMPIAHPQTKGAEFAVWNDMTSYGGGFSWFDIYDRFKDAVMIVSEKTWYGEKTEGQTAEEFVARADALNDVVPGANPGRVVSAESETVTAIGFEETVDNIAKDTSGNDYHAELVNVTIEQSDGSNVASVSGDGYLSLPYDSIGYPYTVMADVKLSADTPENTEIFSGADGILYANIDGTGCLGYARGSYKFTFNYELPKDKWVNLALTCDQKNTTLYINGKSISIGINMGTAINNRKDSTTFVLPVEKILNHAEGSIDNLYIYNRILTEDEINDKLGFISPENIALNKPAKASSVYPGKSWTADKAVDGGKDGDSRWSSKRATGAGDNDDDGQYGTVEQTLTIDLGKTYTVDTIYIKWENAYATKYTLQGSLDGETFFDIVDVTDGTGGEVTFDNLAAETAYIRVACHEALNANWGYSIYELEAYQSEQQVLLGTLGKVKELLEDVKSGTTNGCIEKEKYQGYMDLIAGAEALTGQDDISEMEYSSMKKRLDQAINTIPSDIIFEKDTAQALYGQMNAYEEKDYTEDSFAGFKDSLAALKEALDSASDYKAVNKVMAELENLNQSLVPAEDEDADYSAVDEAIAKANALNKDNYKDFSAVEAAIKAVVRGKDITKQAEVDAMAKAIEDALAGLEYKDADYSKVDAAITAANALDKASYKDFSAVEAAIKAVVRDKDITEQDAVDKMAKAINDAVAALEYKDADYSAVEKAIEAANALNKENYKDFSAVEAAIKAVVRDKDITEQDAVDKMAKAINDAVAALEYKDADYSKVDAAITAANALDKANYKDFSAVEAAIKAVVRGKDITEQDAVDAMAKAIEAAIAGLEKKEPPLPQELPYKDVSEGDWFYDYVYDVYVKELMTGLEKTVFAPNNNIVRAQFAVILYRMEGQPEVTFKDTFPDVKDGNFYSDAVIWAADNGIVTGYTGTGLFGPNDPITREQMAAMMFRYANYKEMDTSEREDLSAFPDGKKVQEFATDAVKWCVAEGIISGKGEEGAKILDPQGNTVRAECATIISRYIEAAK